MKKFILLFVTIVSLLFSNCKGFENEVIYDVLNDLFVEILGVNSYYESYSAFCQRTDNKEVTYDSYVANRLIDDEKKLYVLMKDSVTLINKNLVFEIRNKTSRFEDKYKKALSRYLSGVNRNKSIDLGKIKNTGRYILANISEKNRLLLKEERKEMSFLKVSSVIIDPKTKIGCFYLQLVKGEGSSGFESFYFIKMKDNKWVIDKEVNLRIY